MSPGRTARRYLRAHRHDVRFDFEHPVTDASEARQVLVTMAQQARA